MLITEQNIDIWYNEYKAQFKRSTKYVKSRKGKTRGLEMLSRAEFGVDFRSTALDNPTKSGNQIAKSMAKQEVFAQTQKQAIKSAEAHVAEFGGELTPELVTRYRTQSISDIFDVQNKRREELRAEGKSSGEIAMTISQEFYGSP